MKKRCTARQRIFCNLAVGILGKLDRRPEMVMGDDYHRTRFSTNAFWLMSRSIASFRLDNFDWKQELHGTVCLQHGRS